MDFLVVVLRLVHILTAIVWVGFALFLPLYLAPAIEEAGPEAGKVMGALQRRGLMTLLPLVALASLLSGLWLYWHVSGGFSRSYLLSGPGHVYAMSGLLAIAAYLLGILVTRPAMMRVTGAMQSLGTASPQERERLLAAVQRDRARGTTAGRIGAVLLILAAAGMAVARYS